MEEVKFRDSLGNPVIGTLSIPEHARSVVVISHGFSSSKESRLYPQLESELNALGIGTLRYDYYGHGRAYSQGRKYGVTSDVTLSKCVESLRAAVEYVRLRGDYEVGLFGNSFGGLLSIIVASEDPEIKALVLKSPVTEPKELWSRRLGEKRMREWKETGIIHFNEVGENFELDYGFWLDLQKYDSLDLAQLISCPILIVHGTRDSVVPLSHSQILAEITNAKLKTIKGADHDYADPKEYLSMKRFIVDFFKRRLPRRTD
jgi:uncharacterized protein